MSNVQEPPIRIQLSPVRLAKKICVNKTLDAYHATRKLNEHMENVDTLFHRVKRYITRYSLASSTRSRICSNISYGLNDIVFSIENARSAAHRLDIELKTVDMREVIRDLEKLAIDGNIFFDRTGEKMIFISDNIILEEVEFGRFEIRVPISLQMHNLRVVAITPNICPDNTNITHPHVLGDNLCLGAGQRALKLAFQEGRIIDIIEMINSILRCYNCNDAHQMIQTWKGTVLCRNCDEHTLEEEMMGCDGCQNVFCTSCISKCEDCDKFYCDDCICTSCSDCSILLCEGCTNRCHKCQKYYCSGCMSDNEGNNHCDNCQKAINESEENKEANTQVQPDCVGQTTFFER